MLQNNSNYNPGSQQQNSDGFDGPDENIVNEQDQQQPLNDQDNFIA